mmetsp:Transcript_38581/g.106259  ORF Transcript_38581/g.106259 Transcript_38581/m.106259 type:complete len:568 (-) Transcript_38581:214-1917(-)
MSTAAVSPGSLYIALDVEPSADFATIRTAYRRAALRTHPDKKGGSAEEFRRVLLAFETLSNEESREAYDRRQFLASGSSPEPTATADWQQGCAHRAGTSTARKRARREKGVAEPERRDTERQPDARCRAMEGAQRLNSALDHLRLFLQSMDSASRASALDKLEKDVRAELLRFMETQAEHRPEVAQSDGMAPKPSDDMRLACEETDFSESQDESPSSISSDNEGSFPEGELQMALEDGLLGDDSESAQDFNVVRWVGTEAARHVGDPGRRRRGPKSCIGITGVQMVSRVSGHGQSKYRASIHFLNIDFYTRYQSQIDTAIEHHILLAEMRREAMVVAGTTEVGTAEHANQVALACQKSLAGHGLSSDDIGLKAFVRMRVPEFVAKVSICSPTLALDKVLEWRSRLHVARKIGWPAFRDVWVELLQCERFHRSRTRSEQGAQAFVDMIWKSHALYRARREVHRARREAHAATAEEERRTKRKERCLLRAQSWVLRARAQVAREEKRAQTEAAQEQRKAAAASRRMARQEATSRQRLSKQRWEWLTRRDLTSEEMLSGLPSHLRRGPAM